jgi:hypothetical protein
MLSQVLYRELQLYFIRITLVSLTYVSVHCVFAAGTTYLLSGFVWAMLWKSTLHRRFCQSDLQSGLCVRLVPLLGDFIPLNYLLRL